MRPDRYPKTVLVILTFLSGCSPFLGSGPKRPPVSISHRIDARLDGEQVANVHWGIKVIEAESGKIIFEKNPDQLFMPASNAKLFTTAAALFQLGPEFTVSTTVLADGIFKDSTFSGDMIIVGGGDPALGTRDSVYTCSFLAGLVHSLRERGVSSLRGRMIGDDNHFDDRYLGDAWGWDYLGYGYAAEISALTFNKNIIRLIVENDTLQNSYQVRISPETGYIRLNRQLNFADNPPCDISIERGFVDNHFLVQGNICREALPVEKSMAVHNPTLFTATLITEALADSGFDCQLTPVDADELTNYTTPASPDTLLKHSSFTLGQWITRINKDSENLYAELLLKELGAELSGTGTSSSGIKAINRFISKAGLDSSKISLRDGSGLSRKNLLSPSIIVSLLDFVIRSPLGDVYLNTLPVAATDGTLKHRFLNGPLRGKVFAKTGTLDHVKALSGVMVTKRGKRLLFSFLANHYLCGHDTINKIQEQLCELLYEEL